MSLPSVSVVIPSFNHEAFVAEAVDSALICDGCEIEVIVIDDGSTDGSLARLEAFADDPRVQVHSQPNRGAHSALNRGLDLAQGEVVFILNSDDIFEPQRIPMLTRALADNRNAVLATSWIEVIDANGARLGVKKAWRNLPPWPPSTIGPSLSETGDARLALLETNWISTTSNLAFRRRLVRDQGLSFASLRYAHDWDFVLSACRFGAVELVEEPLLRYRSHGANTIDEGAGAGRELMRFEIMWVVARHAFALLQSMSGSQPEFDSWRSLLWASAPTFGCDAVFEQLLLLRGSEGRSPSVYDALLDQGHPLREAALDALRARDAAPEAE
jgi:hypothetical protein